MLITFIAMMVAVPIGLMSAIYLSEYATSRVRDVVKPLLEILAGVPQDEKERILRDNTAKLYGFDLDAIGR